MATNFYFNNFYNSNEQNLIEELIIESIKMYGLDVSYVPRTIVSYSEQFREQEVSVYNEALPVEAYIKNVDGFEGEGEFLTSFGVQIREQITFSIAYRSFASEVGRVIDRIRPLEGDLIWFGPRNALYTIKYVNMKPVFYQLGALQFYDVTCELFEYSNEVFNTGVAEIDDLYNNYLTVSTGTFDLKLEDGSQLLTEDGDTFTIEEYAIDEIASNAQNDFFEEEAAQVLDFTYIDPFSENERRA